VLTEILKSKSKGGKVSLSTPWRYNWSAV